jgi:hypothetical protein
MENVLSCKICKKKFSTIGNLERHQKRKTVCYEKIECERCFKVFDKLSSLKRHTVRKNPCELKQGNPLEKTPENTCNFCNKKLSNAQNLNRHFNTCEVKKGGIALLFNRVTHLTKMNEEMMKEIINLKSLESNQSNGIVYFVNAENTTMFKIGFTKHSIDKRLANLQTGCPLNLLVYKTIGCDDPVRLEHYLHDCFVDKKIRGEWFNVTFEEIENLVEFLHGN